MTVNTSQGAVLKLLDRIYKSVLNIDDDPQHAAAASGLMVAVLKVGRPLNPKDYAQAWTPFLPNGDATGKPGDDSSIQSAKNVAELVDGKLALDSNASVISGTATVSETWKAIVTGATLKDSTPREDPKNVQWAYKDLWDTKQIEGNERDEQTGKYKMVDAQVHTGRYQKYLDCKAAYQKAVNKYVAAYQTAQEEPTAKKLWPVNGKQFIGDVEDAMNEWVSVGQKVKMEASINILSAQGSDPTALMITDAKNRWSIYQVALGGAVADKSPYSFISPSNWCDPDADIWTKYNGTFSTSETHDTSSTKDWSAGLKLNFGLFSGDAASKGSLEKVSKDAEGQDTDISLEWTVLTVMRPWLDTSLLSWDGWYLLLAGSKKNSISTGLREESNAPSAYYLPIVPVQMIVVRNLKVKNKALSDHFASEALKTSSSLDFNYGPFASVSSSFATDDEKKDEIKRMGREGLRIPGMQLIGWVSELTPASPKLDTPA